jgi:zinc transporter ZupT
MKIVVLYRHMIILISLATFLSTLFGGMFALRFKDKLHLILGFSAGAVIGVAFFDLLPEAISLGGSYFGISTVTSLVALGFAVYLILDRFVFFHSHDDAHQERGTLGAGSLSIHSFFDGVAIGLAFQVSAAVGAIVAIAVLVHDFSDGINTINLVLKNNGSDKRALRWLIIDAIAPVIGVISTMFFSLPGSVLGLILSIFCGFFLYIGASDLLPESQHRHSTYWTTFATVLGMTVLFVAISFANL